MTRHVSAVAIARFREGDLSRRKAARVSSHLAGCLRCTDLSAELAGITILLASTPAPPMPERLAAMIQDTLAAESARRAALDPGTEPGRRDLPGRGARHRRQMRLPAWASPAVVRALAAAGAIVVAGGGYLALSQTLTIGGAGSAAAPARPGATAGSAAQGASLPSAGHSALGPALRYGLPGGQASVVPVATGTNFRPAALASQVTAALSQVSSQEKTLGPATSQPVPAPSNADASRFGGLSVSALEGCVSRIAGGGLVLLVDVARYQGRPATVIVVRPAGSAARQVWVVGPACSLADSDVIARRRLPGG